MEFLKEILAGTKKYFLLDEVAKINVPMCPELTIERILKQVKDIKEITRYLPRINEQGKQYMERDFLFSIVNTIDRKFFKEAVAEVNARRLRNQDQEQGYVEIDPSLFQLIQSCQSRMSGAKLAQSKRTMHALTSLHKKRKAPTKAEIADLNVQLRPTPKLSDDRPSVHDAFFGEMSKIVTAKRRYQ